MSGVSYVDSAGLGALVESSLAAKTRLLQLLEVCDSEAHALESFGANLARS